MRLKNEEKYVTTLKENNLVAEDLISEYVKWVKNYMVFIQGDTSQEKNIVSYRKYLSHGSRLPLWQVDQAIEAIRIYKNRVERGVKPVHFASWDTAIKAVYDDPNFNMYSAVTQKTYIHWLVRLKEFSVGVLPGDVTTAHIKSFIRHVKDRNSLNIASRNHVVAALLYFFRCILNKDSSEFLCLIQHVADSKRPVVIPDTSVEKIFTQLTDHYWYISVIMSECGLRLDEAVCLRVRDIDFKNNYIIVRSNKSVTDRYVLLSDRMKTILEKYMVEVRAEYDAIPDYRRIEVVLPADLLASKNHEAVSWELQWVFPAKSLIVDECDGKVKRSHIHKSSVQRAIKIAVSELKMEKTITPHTFRHCYAIRMLQRGYDLEMVQKMLGQSNINSTLVYTLYYP